MNGAAAPSDQDDERFRITSAVEILSELRGAMAQGALLTLSFGSQNESALTTLLDVDAAEKRLLLDTCSNPAMTAKVTSATILGVETEVRHIRIRFNSERASAATHDGRPALQIPLPTHIVRIQRRDAYRIDTPSNEIVNCRFAHPAAPRRELILRVSNLSVQGMRIVADPDLWQAQPGKAMQDCRIDLPDTGVVHCGARVVRVIESELAGKHRLLIGCQFLQPTGSAGTLLQKYVLELQRTRLARAHGITLTPAYS